MDDEKEVVEGEVAAEQTDVEAEEAPEGMVEEEKAAE